MEKTVESASVQQQEFETPTTTTSALTVDKRGRGRPKGSTKEKKNAGTLDNFITREKGKGAAAMEPNLLIDIDMQEEKVDDPGVREEIEPFNTSNNQLRRSEIQGTDEGPQSRTTDLAENNRVERIQEKPRDPTQNRNNFQNEYSKARANMRESSTETTTRERQNSGTRKSSRPSGLTGEENWHELDEKRKGRRNIIVWRMRPSGRGEKADLEEAKEAQTGVFPRIANCRVLGKDGIIVELQEMWNKIQIIKSNHKRGGGKIIIQDGRTKREREVQS